MPQAIRVPRRIAELTPTPGAAGTVLRSTGTTTEPEWATVSGASTPAYVHTQAVPSATWTIAHNLGWYPNVTVKDSTDRVVVGELAHPDANTVVATFSAAFSGVAYLS